MASYAEVDASTTDCAMSFISPRQSTVQAMALCWIQIRVICNVAETGTVASNMNWGRPDNAWNPRVGVAYQVQPTTVIRAGYGRSFDLGVFGSIFGHAATQNLPVLSNQQVTTTTGITGSAFNLADGPPAPTPIVVPANGLLPSPGYAVTSRARPNPLRLPTIDAWNVSLQQSFTPDDFAHHGIRGQ